MSYRLSECPLCGAPEFAPLLRARDFHYGNPGEYTLVQCTGCSLAFQDPMHEEAELSAFYPDNYYAFTDRFSAPRKANWLRATVKRLLRLDTPKTKDPAFAQPGRMLDIGCGSGWFISQMRDQGWDVKGVEPNAAAAELGRREKGLEIFPGSLLEAGFPPESFDYIRLNHSFEHIERPGPILDEIYRILANNGKLMIGVPNRDSLNARMFGPFWWHLALPVHTFSYSVQTLSRMLLKHHFSVEKVIFNTDLTAIQGSMQLYLNRNETPLKSVGRFSSNPLVTVICGLAAHFQNALHIADAIEVTATKDLWLAKQVGYGRSPLNAAKQALSTRRG